MESDPDRQCPVCLEDRAEDAVTSCGHVFCFACIQEWCRSDNRCPMCKRDVTSIARHGRRPLRVPFRRRDYGSGDEAVGSAMVAWLHNDGSDDGDDDDLYAGESNELTLAERESRPVRTRILPSRNSKHSAMKVISAFHRSVHDEWEPADVDDDEDEDDEDEDDEDEEEDEEDGNGKGIRRGNRNGERWSHVNRYPRRSGSDGAESADACYGRYNLRTRTTSSGRVTGRRDANRGTRGKDKRQRGADWE